ncbi:hypothetical protein QUC31_010347 [Theobroma cacao]
MDQPRVMTTVNGGGAGFRQHALELKSSLSYVSFPHRKSTPGVDVSADEDTEISIFDAQRYFNESNNDARVCKRVSPLNLPNLDRTSSDGCDLSALSRFSSASSATDGYGYGRTYRVRSFHATPTASSEASWNSQTGLLSNPPGAIAVSMTMKNPTIDGKKKESATGTGTIKWLWGRRCPCSSKKSVQVEPKTSLSLNQKLKLEDQKSLGTKSSSWGDKREEILLACNPQRISLENQFHSSSLGQRVVASATARPLMIINGSGSAGFTFPVLNQQPISSHVKMAVNRNNTNSLEVDDEDTARDSLEVFRPSEESSSISVSKKLASRTTITDDDVGSDTSSDLFEIESFSTTTQGQTTPYAMYHRRDALDEASSSFNARRSIAGPTNGSGFGCQYSPVMTECYEPSEASIDWSVTTAEGFERGSVGVSEAEEVSIAAHGNGGKKKSGNGLLSCRCEKAVSVGPNPVKYVPPQGQATTTSKHVGNVNKPPLARLSLPFAA